MRTGRGPAPRKDADPRTTHRVASLSIHPEETLLLTSTNKEGVMDGRGSYLTPKQVMEALSISENVLYREMQYGSLKSISCRIGRQWRVSARGLEQLASVGAE